MIFFFFFQAEDGIRDYKVTGVQTCALPIYLALSPLDKHDEVRHGCHHENDEDRGQDAHGTGAHQLQQTTDGARQTCGDTSKDEDRDAVAQTTFRDLFTEPRSEEHTSELQSP